jgi:hypothetical protein
MGIGVIAYTPYTSTSFSRWCAVMGIGVIAYTPYTSTSFSRWCAVIIGVTAETLSNLK